MQNFKGIFTILFLSWIVMLLLVLIVTINQNSIPVRTFTELQTTSDEKQVAYDPKVISWIPY